LRVSELFLGAMTFGEQGGVGAPLDECRRMVDAYADAGGNVIDTAINYRGGASEEVLGELLQGRRDRFVLATKFGVSRDVKSISDAPSGMSDPNAAGGHRKNLMHSLETSLRRLRTDYVDIYWLHLHDRHTPIDETMRALDDAVRAGKVLYVGVSDTPAWVIARAQVLAEWRGWTAFAGLQVPYSLVQRDIERELLPLAEAHGMTVAAWSPLAGGVLSGKFTRTGAGSGGGVGGGATRRDPNSLSERELAAAHAVDAVADELGTTSSRVAIAWTRQRSPIVHPIVGARTVEQLADNLGVLDVVLPDDAMARLDAAAPVELGFPHDFIAEVRPWVFGEADGRTDARVHPRP
jgi:aryl-alcohol dehydrogenase-like predicted oxidoreductase